MIVVENFDEVFIIFHKTESLRFIVFKTQKLFFLSCILYKIVIPDSYAFL